MQIKNRQQLLIGVVIFAAAVWMADQLIVPSVTKFWTSRAEEIAGLRKKISDGDRLVSRAGSLESRWSYMKTNSFPPAMSITEEIFRQHSLKWSDDSRLSVNSLTGQWKPSDDYLTLDCHMDVSGSLQSVVRFLFNVEQDPMAFRVESMELASRDKDGQQMVLGMQISALILTPSESKP